MKKSWNALEIVSSPGNAEAELVLLSGDHGQYYGARQHADRARQFAARCNFAAKPGEVLDILPSDGIPTRLWVLGMGSDEPNENHWMSLGGFLFETMCQRRLATMQLPDSASSGGPAVLEALLTGALLHSFKLETGRQQAKPEFVPRSLTVMPSDGALAATLARRVDAINRARAWVEQPANVLTPLKWIEDARGVFESLGARVRALGPQELTGMGAGALLAVGRGSEEGSHLLTVEWRGDPARAQWDAVLVGKGLTFDAGGLNLKGRPNINKQKVDMAGGASVLGALELAIVRGSRANVVAIVAMAENAVDALAYRPGDVITSLSGLTIDVQDTDAEGRLVLADALTFGVNTYTPTRIIDVATLTGPVMAVLHEEFGALYASDDRLADELLQAGEVTGERLWRLPLDRSLDYLVESDIADLANCGPPGLLGIGAGSSTAGAKFLEKFTGGTHWAHLDMLGPAWATRRMARSGKGATGFGARLLDQWLAGVEAPLRKNARS